MLAVGKELSWCTWGSSYQEQANSFPGRVSFEFIQHPKDQIRKEKKKKGKGQVLSSHIQHRKNKHFLSLWTFWSVVNFSNATKG